MSEHDKEAARPWYQRHKTLRYRFVRRLSKLSGGWIRSPYYHSVVHFHKQHDVEDCERERIAPDEHIRTWSLWTVEFYTPDNINGLYDALDRLEPTGFIDADRHPGNWLRRARAAAGSSMELYLTPKGRKSWGTGYWCTLPQFAEYATGSIVCVTSSLTVLVTHFALNPSEQKWLDDELHRDHPTRVVQKPGGSISISSPSLEQRRLVREKRESWLRQATEWHRSMFPGLLSTHNEQVSACELSTLAGVVPLEREGQRSNLLAALGLDWSYCVFEGPEGAEPPLFQLSWDANGHGPKEMMYLSATETQFRAQDVDGFGKDDNAYVARLDFEFRRTFAAAALPRVIRFYARRAAHARDGAAAIVGSRNASKALSRVRADTAQCIDASVVARELRDAAERGYLTLHEMRFMRRLEADDQTPITLSEAVRAQITGESDDLLTDVDSLNAGLNAQANLLSAHAALKLQPLIIWLAVLSTIAGLVAAIGPARELISPAPTEPGKSATTSKR